MTRKGSGVQVPYGPPLSMSHQCSKSREPSGSCSSHFSDVFDDDVGRASGRARRRVPHRRPSRADLAALRPQRAPPRMAGAAPRSARVPRSSTSPMPRSASQGPHGCSTSQDCGSCSASSERRCSSVLGAKTLWSARRIRDGGEATDEVQSPGSRLPGRALRDGVEPDDDRVVGGAVRRGLGGERDDLGRARPPPSSPASAPAASSWFLLLASGMALVRRRIGTRGAPDRRRRRRPRRHGIRGSARVPHRPRSLSGRYRRRHGGRELGAGPPLELRCRPRLGREARAARPHARTAGGARARDRVTSPWRTSDRHRVRLRRDHDRPRAASR